MNAVHSTIHNFNCYTTGSWRCTSASLVNRYYKADDDSDDIRCCDNFDAFKRELKTCLFVNQPLSSSHHNPRLPIAFCYTRHVTNFTYLLAYLTWSYMVGCIIGLQEFVELSRLGMSPIGLHLLCHRISLFQTRLALTKSYTSSLSLYLNSYFSGKCH